MKIIQKSLLTILYIGLTWLFFVFVKVILFNDISTESISIKNTPELNSFQYIKRPPVYLISYAAGHEVFFKNQNALALSALNKGIDFILNYRISHIDPKFYNKNKHIFAYKKGAGLWVWKPYLILKTLKEIPENAILIYSDSALTFNNSINILIDKLKDKDIILSSWEEKYNIKNSHLDPIPQNILNNTKCITEACKYTEHLWAGFLVMRNNSTTRAFISKWLQYCEQEDLVSQHHNDETLLWIVHHQLPQKTICISKANLPLTWHHRRNEYETVMPHMKKRINGFERKFFNSSIFITIRKYFLKYVL